MSIRYLIATALMASACAAHADVLPSTSGPGIVNGSSVAGVLGDNSVIAGVSRADGSDALVQALFEKVSASVGSDMKVSLRQGIDGVYVTGLSTAKAAALAGDGMSVVSTADGFKIVASSSAPGNSGGGAATGNSGSGTTSSGTGSPSAPIDSLSQLPSTNAGINAGAGTGTGSGTGLDASAGVGAGNLAAPAAAVPEPSSIALLMAGVLGAAGIRRRRAR